MKTILTIIILTVININHIYASNNGNDIIIFSHNTTEENNYYSNYFTIYDLEKIDLIIKKFINKIKLLPEKKVEIVYQKIKKLYTDYENKYDISCGHKKKGEYYKILCKSNSLKNNKKIIKTYIIIQNIELSIHGLKNSIKVQNMEYKLPEDFTDL